jgi:hypothetical protein
MNSPQNLITNQRNDIFLKTTNMHSDLVQVVTPKIQFNQSNCLGGTILRGEKIDESTTSVNNDNQQETTDSNK